MKEDSGTKFIVDVAQKVKQAQSGEATSDQVMRKTRDLPNNPTGPINQPSDVTRPQVGTDQTTSDLIKYPSKTPLPPSPQTPQPATVDYVAPINPKDYGADYLIPGKVESKPDFGATVRDANPVEVQQPKILDASGAQTRTTTQRKQTQKGYK